MIEYLYEDRIGVKIMDERRVMSIVNNDGSVEKVEIVVSFKFKDTGMEYVVYTKNEKDANGNVTVYVSNIDRNAETPKLLGVSSDAEWSRIKDVLRELSKEV